MDAWALGVILYRIWFRETLLKTFSDSNARDLEFTHENLKTVLTKKNIEKAFEGKERDRIDSWIESMLNSDLLKKADRILY